MNYTEYFKKIDAEIKKADSIVILRHESPDPDAIGSQVGLREIIRATYHNPDIMMSTKRKQFIYLVKCLAH